MIEKYTNQLSLVMNIIMNELAVAIINFNSLIVKHYPIKQISFRKALNHNMLYCAKRDYGVYANSPKSGYTSAQSKAFAETYKLLSLQVFT